MREWVFLKYDHTDAYKKIPLDPYYANLSVVALRNTIRGIGALSPIRFASSDPSQM